MRNEQNISFRYNGTETAKKFLLNKNITEFKEKIKLSEAVSILKKCQ